MVYEGGSVMAQARSLWRAELARTKWSGGFINWYHPMRIRHITTGRYLGVNENNELILLRQTEASLAATTFCLRQEKDDQKVVLEDKDLEIIGAPIIKYGDSTVILQHSESGLWLSYKYVLESVKFSVYLNVVSFQIVRNEEKGCRKSRRETGHPA